MRLSLKTYLTICVLLSCMLAKAQDMQFSQVYSNPLYLNPAFAGTKEKGRISLNYRNQWPGLENEYQSYGAGGDIYLKSLKSGLGFSVIKDVAGINKLSNSRLSLSYSQHVNLTRKSTMAFGIKGSMGQRAFDDSNLLFADQVINETNVSRSQPFFSESKLYGDISAGLLYFRDNLWIGASAHHLNKPNQSFSGSDDVIPIKLSVHGGIKISLKNYRSRNGNRDLNFAFNYKKQGDWDQLDIGGFFTIQHINFGIWYRGLPLKPYLPGYQNHEAVVLMTGYEVSDHWSVGYSFDITISRLTGYTGGAHEISMIYEFSFPPKLPRRRIVPCAKF